jgi:glycosyltransferase involved in cell wall biosynthesis
MSGIDKNIILSICIPTYNRDMHVYKMVNSILKLDSLEFEIVVQDNLSNDQTKGLLENINDNRFHYFRNIKNIGGKLNSAQILTRASGKFSLLCLDRDVIRVEYLDSLIEILKKNKDIIFGYCLLNVKESLNSVIFNKGYDSLYNMTYLSKHPSGNFYKTSVLKDLKIMDKIFAKYSDSDFIHEFFNSEFSFRGKSYRINIPIIETGYTNSKNDFAKHMSFSFNKRNYYFSPIKRIEHFNEYLNEIIVLKISKYQKIKLISKIFFQGIIYSTVSYKNFLNDKHICGHYNVKPKNINLYDFIKISFFFSKSFLINDLKINFMYKLYILLYSNFKFLAYLLKQILKKLI